MAAPLVTIPQKITVLDEDHLHEEKDVKITDADVANKEQAGPLTNSAEIIQKKNRH